jgi:hypothetical protein
MSGACSVHRANEIIDDIGGCCTMQYYGCVLTFQRDGQILCHYEFQNVFF